jgi:hypothetical protein
LQLACDQLVIPDKRYSDHALEDNTGFGPSFVGDIVTPSVAA